jgi:hypothetical protein
MRIYERAIASGEHYPFIYYISAEYFEGTSTILCGWLYYFFAKQTVNLYF